MSGFNQVILVGRLGGNPEVRYTQSGSAVASFSLATGRRVKKGDEWEEVTSWHRCKAFGKQAEVLAEYARKGDGLFVEGRLDYWEAEGKRGKLMVGEVIVEHFDFGARAGGGGDRSAGSGGGPRSASAARRQPPDRPDPAEPFADDDIPF